MHTILTFSAEDKIIYLELTPQFSKKWYGQEIIYTSEQILVQEYKNNGYDIFTTTMSVSPHKDYIKLNDIGKLLSEKYKIDYLWANFKKNDGYLKSINNSKRFELYRQDYCGCIYSNWHLGNKEKDAKNEGV